MTDWDSLKLGFPLQILPGNVQDIRLNHSRYDCKTSDLILCLACRLTIDPGLVRNNGLFCWLDRVYPVEPNMRAGRTRTWPFVFQKYRQNLNGLKRHLRRISELQKDARFSIYERDCERRSRIGVYCHNSFCDELIAKMNPHSLSIQQAGKKASQLIEAIRAR